MSIDPLTLSSLERRMRVRRTLLIREAVGLESALVEVAEERESEFEERAQEDGMARVLERLDDRTRAEIAAIDTALSHIAGGTYGTCPDCGDDIPVERLAAVPAAIRCVRCAAAAEGGVPAVALEARVTTVPPVDPQLRDDRDLELQLREALGHDVRIHASDVRVVCRHAVAYVDGRLAGDVERRIVLGIVAEVDGVREVVDWTRLPAPA